MRARLASTNPHKLAELGLVLPGWSLERLEAAELPPETGTTYVANARAKAHAGRGLVGSGEWVLGEDSGIEAAALGGRPGLESARWAQDGVARLLAELAQADDRSARYVCGLVAISPAGEELVAEGVLPGEIGSEPRGREGFGYDPIFVPDGEERTVAELGDAWKARNSHRARAASALAAAIARAHPAACSSGSLGLGSRPVRP